MPLLTKLYQNTVLIPVFKKLKGNFSIDKKLPFASAKDINQIIKSLNISKAKGPDGISAKFVKISADIINEDISNNKFSEMLKLQL